MAERRAGASSAGGMDAASAENKRSLPPRGRQTTAGGAASPDDKLRASTVAAAAEQPWARSWRVLLHSLCAWAQHSFVNSRRATSYRAALSSRFELPPLPSTHSLRICANLPSRRCTRLSRLFSRLFSRLLPATSFAGSSLAFSRTFAAFCAPFAPASTIVEIPPLQRTHEFFAHVKAEFCAILGEIASGPANVASISHHIMCLSRWV